MNNQNILEKPALNYNPSELKRELNPYYIGASEVEIDEMLSQVGSKSLDDLFSHIPNEILFQDELNLPEALEYEALQDSMWTYSRKNNLKTSFIEMDYLTGRPIRLLAISVTSEIWPPLILLTNPKEVREHLPHIGFINACYQKSQVLKL